MSYSTQTIPEARGRVGLTVQVRWSGGQIGWFTISERTETGHVAPGSDLAMVLSTVAVGDVLVLADHRAVTVTEIWASGGGA